MGEEGVLLAPLCVPQTPRADLPSQGFGCEVLYGAGWGAQPTWQRDLASQMGCPSLGGVLPGHSPFQMGLEMPSPARHPHPAALILLCSPHQTAASVASLSLDGS